MVISLSFLTNSNNWFGRSMQRFKDPLLLEKQIIETKVREFRKGFLETSGDYFKIVTTLPQFIVGLIHFVDTGGFPAFYEHSYDIHICLFGLLGEGAALMYEVYRAYYHDARWSQIGNYSLTTFVFYYYGMIKEMHIFIWKQNWCFLMIPVLCVVRLKLLKKSAAARSFGLILTFLLYFVVGFRLYTIYRIVDLIRMDELPLLFIVGMEALIEIFWLWCFARSIMKSCSDVEVLEFLIPCYTRPKECLSTDLDADDEVPPMKKLKLENFSYLPPRTV